MEDYIKEIEAEYDQKQAKIQGKRAEGEEGEEVVREKPCFVPSGLLAEFSNRVNGTVLKFSEPQDAEVPMHKWRFYVFKGEETMPELHIHR